MNTQTLILFACAAISVGGVAWVFLLPVLSGERHMEKRKANVARHTPARSSNTAPTRTRREQVEASLKELEKRQNREKPTIEMRLTQAGLDWSRNKFLIVSGALGLFVFLFMLVSGLGLLAALSLGFTAALGLPRWLLTYLKRRRERIFLNAFPDAIDALTRGIKAGLPLLDSMKMLVSEAGEPLKSEFRAIVETQTIGTPLGEACTKLYERMPLAEANFFGIVISIQQRSGGNLSEALGNLSKVLRDRKKMAAKIQAMSMEAKASATIIGALPVAVATLVWLTSPTYIELLWTHPTGQLMLAGCAIWMFMGCMVMRKMINFDF